MRVFFHSFLNKQGFPLKTVDDFPQRVENLQDHEAYSYVNNYKYQSRSFWFVGPKNFHQKN